MTNDPIPADTIPADRAPADRIPRAGLHSLLRLVVLTDRALAAPRAVPDVVEMALEAGARAIQLRDKSAGSGRMLEDARVLRELTSRYGALLFVNDRIDVALAAEADGVHLGPDDIPVAAARAVCPPDFLIGYSTDVVGDAIVAEEDGADYLGSGTVYPTSNKSDAGNVIGLAGLDAVARSVRIPVVGIGGITAERSAEVAAQTEAAGVAVLGAVMSAADPRATVPALLAPWR